MSSVSLFALIARLGNPLLATLLLISSAAGSTCFLLLENRSEPPASTLPNEHPMTEPKKPQATLVRTDRHGDPLPDGAIARLGTVRWRHGLYVHDLAYSHDGKSIAAVGPGRTLTLWDAASGKEIRPFPNRNPANAVAFSPDGKVLGTISESICHLWDVATGKELRQLKGHTKLVRGLVFAPDGKTLATVGNDETACIWDAKDGKELHRIDCKQGYIRAVTYSPDGRFLATAGQDGTIRLWDPATGATDRQLTRHKSEVWKLVFSPGGTRLASSGADETIRLWDVTTAQQIRVFGEKLGKYNLPIAFSPDGTSLAAGVGEGFIRLWNANDGAQKRQWQAGVMNVRALAFSPDGKTLASGAAWEGIRLWDTATGRERHPSEEHLGMVEFVRFSPDGASLASISRERRLVWWDLAKQTPRRQVTWGGEGVGVSETALSPDGTMLAVGSWSDAEPWKVCLFDSRTGKVKRELGEPQRRFSSLAFSPDGRLVASKGSDQVIHIWDVHTGTEVRRISENANTVVRLRFSPDSTTLAAGCYPGRPASGQPALRLWDVSSGKERCRFDCHVPAVFALAFSPDGKVLATGDADLPADCLVRLWDTATGRGLSCHSGHPGEIAAVAFSPDGKLVASGTGSGVRDDSVHVWEAATGQLIRRFEGQRSNIASLAFSPDGLAVASGAGDSTILLWDITGRRADGHWHVKPLTPRELDACWEALADADAAKGYDAVWALVAAPDQAPSFLRKYLTPIPRPDANVIARLIAELDSEDFAVRQKSAEELAKFGDAIIAVLQRTLEGKPSLEVRRRVQQLLAQSRDWTPERLRAHRVIQALEHIGTRQAKEALQALAEGPPKARRTEEAKAALERMSR